MNARCYQALHKALFKIYLPVLHNPQTADGELLIAQLGGGGANVSSGEYFYLPGLPVTSLKNGRLPLPQKVLWEYFLDTTSFLDKCSSYYYCITKYYKCKSVKKSFYLSHRFCESGIQAVLDWTILPGGCSQILAEAADI